MENKSTQIFISAEQGYVRKRIFRTDTNVHCSTCVTVFKLCESAAKTEKSRFLVTVSCRIPFGLNSFLPLSESDPPNVRSRH